jgi:hypothetical protein
MTDEPDIKDLLSRALGDHEPPLRIDRDEVFRTGRKRLRRRRVFEAGGAVAAVVVAAVGASLLTGLVGDEENHLPPAASSSDVAPPGPGLPLTPSVPTTRSSTPYPLVTEAHAAILTDNLYNSGLIKDVDLLAVSGFEGKPKFVTSYGSYVLNADVARAGLEGGLNITVEIQTEDVPVNCGDMPQPGDCAVNLAHGVGVAVSNWTAGKVTRRSVRTILSDGSKVTAVATNHSNQQLVNGKSPNNPKPPLSEDDLVKLVLECGLRVT